MSALTPLRFVIVVAAALAAAPAAAGYLQETDSQPAVRGPHTGLVLLLRQPLSRPPQPEIVTPDGSPVLRLEAQPQQADSLGTALRSSLAGDNPLVVRVESIGPGGRLAVSPADAEQLRRAGESGGLARSVMVQD